MARAYDLSPDPGMTGEFDFRLYPDVPFEVGPFTVSAVPMAHPVPAYGLRISHHGRTLVYTGDTGPCDNLDVLSKGADLLLSEASFLETEDNPGGLHLTGKDAALAAERAAAARLVLTHIPSWYSEDQVLDEARPHFSGDVSLARCGVSYDV
jgi:ribonuclease BN (tRNA processing enzyme)